VSFFAWWNHGLRTQQSVGVFCDELQSYSAVYWTGGYGFLLAGAL